MQYFSKCKIGAILKFKCSANVILTRRRDRNTFIIDSFNEPIIEQLYLYLLMDDRFDGDLHKGIMLMGKYGCGKTIIMEAFVERYNTIVTDFFICDDCAESLVKDEEPPTFPPPQMN